MKNKEEISLGISEFSREEIDLGIPFNVSRYVFSEKIKHYEDLGYRIIFVKSLIKRIFRIGKYKVMAIKN